MNTNNQTPTSDDWIEEFVVKVMRGARKIAGSTTPADQSGYTLKEAEEALKTTFKQEQLAAITNELQSLYDYASSGTRAKTLLGNRIAAIRKEMEIK